MAVSLRKPDKLNSIMILFSIFMIMTPAQAFFRHLCFSPLGYARVDPIVSPGQLSAHLHHLHGSGNLSPDSVDADYLLEANCTSCSITVDKSGYWAPAMYFQHENGGFELLNTSGSITIYYKTEKRTNFEDQTYVPFPKGFRMVAGHAKKRSWVGPWPIPAQSFWGPNDTTQEALASKSIGFNCLNYYRGWDEATFAYGYLREKNYTDANCLQGIRAEILFPSCWDGVNLDSPDHQSHVAYPTLLQDGACPQTHPVYLPVLFYETIWNTFDFIGVPGRYVLSNGDPTGYGYHADFLAAWEDGILEAVMADPTCTDHNLTDRHTDGITEECLVFKDRIQPQEVAAQCKLELPAPLFQEKFVNHSPALPGNMEISGHRHDPGTEPEDDYTGKIPAAASGSSLPPAVSSETFMPPPPVETSEPPPPPAETAVTSSQPMSSVASISSSAPETPAAPTITPPPPTAIVPVISTSTFVSDGVLYVVEVVESVITVTSTVTPTNTTTVTVSRVRHKHRHLHRGGF